ncbi:MAG: hypothetical protein FJ202_02100 [Gemmatimonadetes bacterium]|nr:hypothetical protein [Gemmatimonadota bacterium]
MPIPPHLHQFARQRLARAAAAVAFAGVGAASVPEVATAQIVRDSTARVPVPAAAAPTRLPFATPADSAARMTVAQFEYLRRFRLPPSMPKLFQTCIERVGSLCYWYDEASRLPDEDAEVRAARLRLLATLDSLGKQMPTNLWISEQRVRYLVEAGRPADALAVARACITAVTVRWECETLEGLARHELGEYVAAERSFEDALARMDERARCAWTALYPVLDEAAIAEYRVLPCGSPARAAWEARTWALSRTLFSMPGNDLRTEYFARRTMVRMLSDAATAFQNAFNADEEDLVLRFGWPRGWSALVQLPVTFSVGQRDGDPQRTPGGPGGFGVPRGRGRGGTPVGSYPPGTKVPANVPPLERPPDISGPRGLPGVLNRPPDATDVLPRMPGVRMSAREGDGVNSVPHWIAPAFRMIPPGFSLTEAANTDSTAWRDFEPPVMARYGPAFAKRIVPLEHQQAVFKRGDSALLVVAYSVASLIPRATRITAAAVATPARTPVRDYMLRRESATHAGHFVVAAPWGPLLMSAEVHAPGEQLVARARYGVGPLRVPSTRVVLSDILLFEGGGATPTDAESAAAVALTSERVRSSRKLGVFWETYGTNPEGETMQLSVIVLRETGIAPRNVLRRIAGAVIGTSRDETPVRVTVNDLSARGRSDSPRAIELDIATLKPGVYIVQLEVTVAGQQPLRSEKRISVTGR